MCPLHISHTKLYLFTQSYYFFMNWTKELKCQQCDYPINFQIFSSVKINYAEETTLNSDTKTGKIEKI